MVNSTGLNTRSTKIPFKKTVLALSVMAVATAHAQTDTEQSTTAVEEVVITGVRQNIINAQQIKRDAETFVDAISAEDIGSLPDASVLEALQRVPGISIERFASPDDSDHFSSEGSNVTLRGLPQTRTSFNGRDSFSATSGRGLSFEDVSKDLLGSVEIVKNQTADMIEGGISGTITLNTRKPFDTNGRQLAFSAQANYGDFRGEVTPDFSGLFSDIFEVGDLGEIGFLVSYSESRLKFRSDGTEIGKYQFNNVQRRNANGELVDSENNPVPLNADGSPAENNPDGTKANAVALDPGVRNFNGEEQLLYTPNNGGIRSTDTDRFRRGLATSLQFRSADSSVEATLEYVRSQSKSIWNEFAFISDDGRGRPANFNIQNTSFNPDTDVIDDRGVFTSGVIKDVPNAFGPQTRESDTREVVEDTSFNLRWQATDRLALTFDAQFIEATNDVEDLSIFGGLRNGLDIFVDDNGGSPIVDFRAPDSSTQTDAEYFADPTNYFFRAAMDHIEESEAEEKAFQIDLDYDVDVGVFKSFEAGVRYAERDQTTRWSAFNWQNLSETWNGGQVDFAGSLYDGDNVTIADSLNTPATSGAGIDDFHREGNGLGFTGLFIDPRVVSSFDNFQLFTSRNVFPNSNAGLSNRGNNFGLPLVNDRYFPTEINPTIEENQAAYIKFNLEGDNFLWTGLRFSSNIGFRYVQQDTTVSGAFSFPQQVLNSDGSVADENSERNQSITDPRLRSLLGRDFEPQVANSEYDTVLPSLNLKVELTDELIARAAYSKAISFPDLGALRYNYDVNFLFENDTFDRVQQISGNPFLTPMEADNFDLSLEWYFADSSSLTVGAFYKDIVDFFATGVTQREVLPAEGVTFASPLIIDVNQPINIDEAEIYGLEIGFQHFFENLPDALDGLGMQFNFTRLWQNGAPNQNVRSTEFSSIASNALGRVQETFDDLPLQGMSDVTLNLVGIYDTEYVSARLAYNYRSDYLLTYNNTNLNQPVFSDSTESLDGSVFYKLNDNVQLGVTGTNLTNFETTTKIQIDQQGTKATRNAFINDRRYSLVFRYTL